MDQVQLHNGWVKSLSMKIGKTLAVGTLSLYLMPMAQAQTASATTEQKPANPVFQQCAATVGVTLPAPGSGQRLDRADRKKFWSCVKTERKQAFQACAQASGVTPPQPGAPFTKPTKDEIQAIHQCMTDKGFKRFHARHNHHRRNWNDGQQSAPVNS